jgi:hypothetical protein
MKPDLPTDLSKAGLEAIEAARSAARRRGVSVHQWLQDAIVRSALRPGVDSKSGVGWQGDADENASPEGGRCSLLQKIPNRPCDDGTASGLLWSAVPAASTAVPERQVCSFPDESGSERRIAAPALAPLRDLLTETRDALRGATEALQLLSKRIERVGDPAAHRENLRQLEEAVAAVRGTMSQLASSDAIAMLSQEVRGLTNTIEQAVNRTGDEIVRTLEGRLIRIADVLARRYRLGQNRSDELESLIKVLIDKIQRGTSARDAPPSIRLEELIADLGQKLDITDARVGKLQATEGRVEQLLLDSQRNTVLARIPGQTPKSEMEAPHHAPDVPRAEKQTGDILEAVRGMLGEVLDRLAAIDARLPGKIVNGDASGIASGAPAEPPCVPISFAQTRSENAARGSTEDGQTSQTGMRPGTRSPSIEPSSPSGVAFELASGMAGGCTTDSGADRTVSGAGVAGADKSDTGDHSGKSDFIAAARRAVHTARQQVIENNHTSKLAEIISDRAKPPGGIGKLTALIGLLTGVLTVLGGSPITRALRGSGDETKVGTLDQVAARAGAASPFAAAADDRQVVR